MVSGDELREIFETVLPRDAIDFFAIQLGVLERERKVDIARFVRASVIAAGTPFGGLQADAIRNYFDCGGPRVARSAIYRRFDESYEQLMQVLAENALAYARKQELDLPGILAGVTDWRIVDSTTVKVRNVLKSELPGTGDYAAIKVHKTLSVGSGATVAYHFSAAREHDTHHLTIDESWKGYGLLADLGYASLGRLRACVEHQVRFVIRLKENWKPKVEHIARGEVTGTFFPGTDLDVLLENEVLLLNGRVIDADVQVGSGSDALQLRLVGIPTPKGYCFFLTNLPPSIGPMQVGDLYRIRWEVELSMKLDKSAYRLDQGKGERTCSTQALLHASMISSILTALIAHKHNLRTRPQEEDVPRTIPPVHHQLLALAMIQSSYRIACAFELRGEKAIQEWSSIANCLIESGKDPNWRRNPSVLDQIRGYQKTKTRSKTKQPQLQTLT